MCFYRGTVYKCNHTELGKKVSDCEDQRDFLAGTTKGKNACSERRTHSMNRVRVDTKCEKCQRLDALRTRTRKTLLSLQENMEKRKASIGKYGKETPKADDADGADETLKDGLSSNVAFDGLASNRKRNTFA
ncbi:hypothetical protein LZ32DRAFT_619813 [Colletotrichum eremochloae]|nr:hypothetical protein LZ32DRAFT_619813 [Colletotrichum eremochloae]